MASNFLKKKGIYFLFLLTLSCTSTLLMTRPEFDQITLGARVETVISAYGPPYSIHSHSEGIEEYKYIERVLGSNEVVEENRYTLVVKNGVVISKRYNQEFPSPYHEFSDDDPNTLAD
ncbi:hypothetical protein [Rhabdochlamydiaceae symbiont of Dictyostelium giganteum]|uniref:hypothetical protein n=1 Tax=Rhabdochlamydiaceae symbiont of Dictyostelium giganteum TaxID=3342349 RepID=UPI00384B92B9